MGSNRRPFLSTTSGNKNKSACIPTMVKNTVTVYWHLIYRRHKLTQHLKYPSYIRTTHSVLCRCFIVRARSSDRWMLYWAVWIHSSGWHLFPVRSKWKARVPFTQLTHCDHQRLQRRTWRFRFESREFHTVFAVDQLAPGQLFRRVLRLPLSVPSANALYSVYDRRYRCTVLANTIRLHHRVSTKVLHYSPISLNVKHSLSYYI